MAGHAAPHSSKLTYDDYVTLPDDGRRYEILDGELAVSRRGLSSQHPALRRRLATGARAAGLRLPTWDQAVAGFAAALEGALHGGKEDARDDDPEKAQDELLADVPGAAREKVMEHALEGNLGEALDG